MPEQNPTTPTVEQFFTRARANEGITLPLARPDGTATDLHIKIRGVDSDMLKAAQAASRRRMMEAMASLADKDKKPSGPELEALVNECRLDELTALVISWNIPDWECTPANIKKLLTEAPQIADQIDKLSSRRALFFMKGSATSTPTPASSSS